MIFLFFFLKENAILYAHGNLEGAKLFVTLFPCNKCTRIIIQKGITEVYYASDKHWDKDETKGKKYALKKYDQFIIIVNTGWIWDGFIFFSTAFGLHCSKIEIRNLFNLFYYCPIQDTKNERFSALLYGIFI